MFASIPRESTYPTSDGIALDAVAIERYGFAHFIIMPFDSCSFALFLFIPLPRTKHPESPEPLYNLTF